MSRYRALYAYDATHDGALSFVKGDLFDVVDTSNRDWWLVSCSDNVEGYVPANYLENVKVDGTEEILTSVDRAIDLYAKQTEHGLENDLHYRNLLKYRNKVERAHSTKRRAPDPPQSSNASSQLSETSCKENELMPEVPPAASKSDADVVSHLLESIQSVSSVTHSQGSQILSVVFAELAEAYPELRTKLQVLLKTLGDSQRPSDDCGRGRMEQLFSCLEAARLDAQQRSWALRDDEGDLSRWLADLLHLVESSAAATSLSVLSQNSYGSLHSLILYHQMEPRVELRLSCLRLFGSFAALGLSVLRELLNSVLPAELARSMHSSSCDRREFDYSALVLTMIFSAGEQIPVSLEEYFDVGFFTFLLESLETAESDDTVDLLLHLLLAFNLHPQMPSESPVVDALAQYQQRCGTPKLFTERLLIKFNRGDDPVKLFEFLPRPLPHSLYKLLSDIFAVPAIANLFYTNDSHVLIDVLLRQTADLPSGEPIRTEALSLLHLIVQNTPYAEHQYRSGDLCVRLSQIHAESDPSSQQDRCIVDEIWSSCDVLKLCDTK